jgi:hypothetical protein
MRRLVKLALWAFCVVLGIAVSALVCVMLTMSETDNK